MIESDTEINNVPERRTFISACEPPPLIWLKEPEKRYPLEHSYCKQENTDWEFNEQQKFKEEDNLLIKEEPSFSDIQIDVLWKCSECMFESTDENLIQQHEISHANKWAQESSISKKVPIKKRFKHLSARHKGNKPKAKHYQCKLCPFESRFSYNVTRHRNSFHQHANCDKSTFRAFRAEELVPHVAKNHTGVHRVRWPDQSSSNNKLNRVRKEDGVKFIKKSKTTPNEEINSFTYKCGICLYVTDDKDLFRIHLRKHTLDKYKIKECDVDLTKKHLYACKKCTFTTRFIRLLYAHLKHHNTEVGSGNQSSDGLLTKSLEPEVKRNNSFRCGDCDFKTKYKRYLKMHMKKHDPLNELKEIEASSVYNQNPKIGTESEKSVPVSVSSEPSAEQTPNLEPMVHCETRLQSSRSDQGSKTKRKDKIDLSKYKCRVCLYTSNDRDICKSHVRKHTLDRYKINENDVDLTKNDFYQCKKCNFNTKFVNIFKIHLRWHNTKVASGNEPTHKSSVENFVEDDETGVETKNSFCCGQCSFKTNYKKYMEIHMNKHSPPDNLKRTDLSPLDNPNLLANKESTKNLEPSEEDLSGLKPVITPESHTRNQNKNLKTCFEFISKYISKYVEITEIDNAAERIESTVEQCKKNKVNNFVSVMECNTDHTTLEDLNPLGKEKSQNKIQCVPDTAEFCAGEPSYLGPTEYSGKQFLEPCELISGVNSFKCGLCDFATKYKKYFDLHMSTHKPSKIIAQCENSDVVEIDKPQSNMTFKEEEMGFKCVEKYCNFVTNSSEYLDLHLKEHIRVVQIDASNILSKIIPSLPIKEQKEAFKCINCDFVTNFKEYIELHVKKHEKSSELLTNTEDGVCEKLIQSTKNSDFENSTEGDSYTEILSCNNEKDAVHLEPQLCPTPREDETVSTNVKIRNLTTNVQKHQNLQIPFKFYNDGRYTESKEDNFKNKAKSNRAKKRQEDLRVYQRRRRRFKCDKCNFSTNIFRYYEFHKQKHVNVTSEELQKTNRKPIVKNLFDLGIFIEDLYSYKETNALCSTNQLHDEEKNELLKTVESCNSSTNISEHLEVQIISNAKVNSEICQLKGSEDRVIENDPFTNVIDAAKLQENLPADREKKFKCGNCKFSTNFKKILEFHIMKHEKSPEILIDDTNCNTISEKVDCGQPLKSTINANAKNSDNLVNHEEHSYAFIENDGLPQHQTCETVEIINNVKRINSTMKFADDLDIQFVSESEPNGVDSNVTESVDTIIDNNDTKKATNLNVARECQENIAVDQEKHSPNCKNDFDGGHIRKRTNSQDILIDNRVCNDASKKDLDGQILESTHNVIGKNSDKPTSYKEHTYADMETNSTCSNNKLNQDTCKDKEIFSKGESCSSITNIDEDIDVEMNSESNTNGIVRNVTVSENELVCDETNNSKKNVACKNQHTNLLDMPTNPQVLSAPIESKNKRYQDTCEDKDIFSKVESCTSMTNLEKDMDVVMNSKSDNNDSVCNVTVLENELVCDETNECKKNVAYKKQHTSLLDMPTNPQVFSAMIETNNKLYQDTCEDKDIFSKFESCTAIPNLEEDMDVEMNSESETNDRIRNVTVSESELICDETNQCKKNISCKKQHTNLLDMPTNPQVLSTIIETNSKLYQDTCKDKEIFSKVESCASITNLEENINVKMNSESDTNGSVRNVTVSENERVCDETNECKKNVECKKQHKNLLEIPINSPTNPQVLSAMIETNNKLFQDTCEVKEIFIKVESCISITNLEEDIYVGINSESETNDRILNVTVSENELICDETNECKKNVFSKKQHKNLLEMPTNPKVLNAMMEDKVCEEVLDNSSSETSDDTKSWIKQLSCNAELDALCNTNQQHSELCEEIGTVIESDNCQIKLEQDVEFQTTSEPEKNSQICNVNRIFDDILKYPAEPSELEENMAVDLEKTFQCNSCSFATKFEKYLKLHLSKHKKLPAKLPDKPGQMDTQLDERKNCRSTTMNHYLDNYTVKLSYPKNSEKRSTQGATKIKKYECRHCRFKTKFKEFIVYHEMRHTMKSDVSSEEISENPSKLNRKYKCTKCDFSTHFTKFFEVHLEKHASK